jgi:hypothetical protein
METKDHKFDGKEDRNYYQKPFDENTDNLSQMDEGSAKMADKGVDKKTNPENENAASSAEGRDSSGYANEINDDDTRDQGDSTSDWNAQHNRTGRHR